MEETVNISTKYPEIVEAAQKQGIKVSDVFAKCKDVDGDGIVDASYPMVKLVNSQIPRTDDGTIIFDVGRLSAAKAYSVKNHESEDVVDKIDNAAESMRDLKSIQSIRFC